MSTERGDMMGTAFTRRPVAGPATGDAAWLLRLGYRPELRRRLGPVATFALAYSCMSPVITAYALFTSPPGVVLGLPLGWGLVVAAVGQLLVALVLGEVVAQFPLTGGLYAWVRRLWGRRSAWLAAWVYGFAMLGMIAGLGYGAGPYLATVVGFEPSVDSGVGCAVVLVAVATAVNLAGTRALGVAVTAGLVVEVAGILVVGTWVLLSQRHRDLSVLFDPKSAAVALVVGAGLFGVFQFSGFEAAGSVAEEVADPARRVPRALWLAVVVGGVLSTYVCVVLMMTAPGPGAHGSGTGPLTQVLYGALGPAGGRAALGIVLLCFLSGIIGLQAAAGRLLFSAARDGMLPGSRLLATVSVARAVPAPALVVAGAVPVLLVYISRIFPGTMAAIGAFAVLGIYLGVQTVVLAALRARVRGWRPAGGFSLGRWAFPVNVGALAYGVVALVCLLWPPLAGSSLPLVAGALVVSVGLAVLALLRPHRRSGAIAGDAVRPPAG
ncbi:APC family permease [Amycolatopsis suaedae]|nr:APC family permease [Amycolatopsis suaedae]